MKHRYPRLLAASGLLLATLVAPAQQRPGQSFFVEDGAARAAAGASAEAMALTRYRALTLDAGGLRAALATAPPAGRAGAAALVLALPLPDGSSARFAVREAPVMEPSLAAQLPDIRTYAGVGLDDATATVRLDVTAHGFHAQVLSDATGTFYIDPARPGDQAHSLSFWKRDMNRAAAGNAVPTCGFAPTAADLSAARARRAAATASGPLARSSGGTLRTFRLAVAATGEYTAFHGGTVALAQAAIVTSVNRVVGVYEREVAVRMVLVANNTSIVYTNSATDPYTNNNGSTMLGQNQTNVNAVIGSANYDIGHVFSTGGGGVAFLGCVCSASNKAKGVTGSGSPVGDTFDIDYVAHEMGHQFGGNHTFNNNTGGSCTGNRNAGTAYEPGSGSTIMAYAGICGDDVQNNSDPYFHTASYDEVMTFLGTISCGTSAGTGLSAPVLTLPASSLTLPKGTPFHLTASATNPNGRTLTYCWEQYDLSNAATRTTAQVTNDDVPLFRSVVPNVSPTRFFPNLPDLTANTNSNTAGNERLPTVARPLTFRCTVRDSYETANGPIGAVTNTGTVALTVNGTAGPFLVTAPNTAITWTGGSSQTVTWNVAGTTTNNVNCANVNILLSTDGGLTYPTTLLANTANDGTATVTAPNTATTTARVMVEAVGNYFFDISNANFTITAGAVCDVPTNVTVSSITTTTASVNWTASATASGGYTVTTSPASTTQTVSGTSANLTGLTSGTAYTVSVVSNCAAGATSVAATAPFSTTAGCNAPTNLTVSNIGGNSATLNFTGNGAATNYTVSTVPASTTQTVSGTTATLSGLTPNTAYTVNVVSNCAGGTTSPAGTTNFTSGPAGPANDDCASNVLLTSATACTTTAGTVTGATQSQTPINCAGFTATTALDVWYRFVANNATHTITVAGSNFDGVMEVLSGSCGSLTNVGCRDALGSGGETLTLSTLTAGTTYFVRYYAFGPAQPANGAFTICVTNPALPCNAPTNVTVSAVTSTSATASYTASASASSGYSISTSPASSTQTVSGTSANLTGLTPGTAYTVSVVSNCAAGATSGAATAPFSTTAAPVVTSVVAPANATYIIGQNLNFTINFDQSITVNTAGGTPSLPLAVGSTARQATYLGGSGTTALTFRYTVPAGDFDANGVTLGAALALNGGTLRNAGGTNANLTLNGVASTTGVLVDGVAPTVSSSNRQTPAAALTNAASVVFRVVFSESVTGVSSGDFALSTTGTAAGTISAVAAVSGSGNTGFDVTVNALSGDGTLRLDVNASGTGITDAPGNALSGGLISGQTYILDHTNPQTTIDSQPAAITTSTSATFTFSGTDVNGVLRFEASLDGGSFATTSSPVTYSGLALGGHTFAVRAVDNAGNTDASPATYSWTVVTAACDAPTSVAVSSITGTTASVSFVASATAIGGYTVTTTPASTTQTVSGTSASLTGLTPGTAYTVNVVSSCAGGVTSGAATATFSTTCPPPTALSTTATSTTATVSFTAASGANTYTVTTVPVTTTQTVSASPVSFAGLTPGTAYTVSIHTNCAAGNASATASTSFSTLPTPCNAATGLSMGSIGSTTASLSFTPSATASSYTLTTVPATSTYTVTTSPVTLTGLMANTSYTLNLVSNCGGGATSPAASIGFTTDLADLVVSTTLNLPGGSYRNVTVTGPATGGAGTLQLGNALSVSGTLLVQDGGTLQSNCNAITGTGNFMLAAGATLHVCSPQGISASGASGEVQLTPRSFSDDASYLYAGNAQVTGSGLPATVRSLSNLSATALDLTQAVAVRRMLTLNGGDLRLGTHNLTLLSDAAFTAMVVNAGAGVVLNNGSGVATMQRHISPATAYAGPGYRHYSSPVQGTTVADLTVPGLFAPQVNAAYNALPAPALSGSQFPNVFDYEQSRLTPAFPTFATGWRSPAGTGSILAPTRSYTVNIAPAATVDLTGSLNNGSLNTGPLGRAPQAEGGWQLLGNPYPAPLNWATVTATPGALPAGLADAIYVFEPTSQYGGQYRAFINGVGQNGFTGVLPAMQGFFIRTTQAVPGGFNFQNAYRATTYTNPAFLRPVADARPLLRLVLSAVANPALTSDETVLYLTAGATATGTDARFDAPKLPNPGTALSLATQLPGAANEALAISGLPLANLPNRIPLVLSAPAAGSYRLAATALQGFAPNQPVLLFDAELNLTTDLRQQPDYVFPLGRAGANAGRFALLLGPAAGPLATGAAAEAISFQLWPNPTLAGAALRVVLPATLPAATVTLRDVLGRTVARAVFAGASASLPTAGLASGTYLLTVQAPGKAPATQRVVLE